MKKIIYLISIFMLITVTACGNEEKNKINEVLSEKTLIEENEKDVEIPSDLKAKSHPIADHFDGGDGTKENPYEIANAEQLTLMAELINHKNLSSIDENRRYSEAYYLLTADIEFNDTSDFLSWNIHAPEYVWEPIGNFNDGSYFSGSFDGNNHQISGLFLCTSNTFSCDRISSSDKKHSGEFGFFSVILNDSEKTVIKNLKIDKSFYKTIGEVYNLGGIAGNINNTRIENCEVNIIMDTDYIYQTSCGIVAKARNSEIVNCIFNGEITGFYELGGIVGEMAGGKIENCSNNGNLLPKNSDKKTICAGIVSEVNSITEFIPDPDAKGWTLSGKNVPALSLIKNCTNYSDCVNSGIIYNALSGYGELVIENCKNYGNLSSITEMDTGGIISRAHVYCSDVGNEEKFSGALTIKDSINYGSLDTRHSSSNASGGIVGSINNSSIVTVENCNNFGEINGEKQLGGIVGSIIASSLNAADYSQTLILNCKNEGKIEGQGSYVGGIVGSADYYGKDNKNTDIKLNSNHNSGEVIGQGYGVGGILGAVLGMHGESVDSIVVSNNLNSGLIKGRLISTVIGGIVGYFPCGDQKQSIINCENTGVISLVCEEACPTEPKIDPMTYPGLAAEIVGAAQDNVLLENCSTAGKIEIAENYQDLVISNSVVGIWMHDTDMLFFR